MIALPSFKGLCKVHCWLFFLALKIELMNAALSDHYSRPQEIMLAGSINYQPLNVDKRGHELTD
jgi:hypothetical protein